MKLNHIAMSGLLLAVLFTTAHASYKHPGVAHPPRLPLEAVYRPDATDPAISRGDICFTLDKPALSDLSSEEIYIVAGAKVSDLPDGRSLLPWADQVFNAVLAFYKEYQQVPAILDEAAIRSIPGYSNITAAELEIFRNPFNGQWPRLNAASHSPGDMYLRKLTEAETKEFARLLGWTELWFGTAPGPHLCSPVFYQRIYGRNSTIYEALPHVLCER